MPQYEHNCKWCRHDFTSSRPHSVFCSNACSVYSCRILKDFYFVESDIPDNIVKANNYFEKYTPRIVYLNWYHRDDSSNNKRRFADLYVAKRIGIEMENKMKRKKKIGGIRYLE